MLATPLEHMGQADTAALHAKELLLDIKTPLPRLHRVSAVGSVSGPFQLMFSLRFLFLFRQLF